MVSTAGNFMREVIFNIMSSFYMIRNCIRYYNIFHQVLHPIGKEGVQVTKEA